jgi:glycosyltransferase involved in cell wall biosynthesis
VAAHRRVAVGATLHNKAEYLPAAIDSLLAQTYRDYTLVLLDDASTDDTPAIARRYADADDRVVFIRNETRVGMIENWRRAYHHAKNVTPDLEYFAWGSDHDLWEPHFLERLVATLDDDPSVVLAYPRSIRVDEEGGVIREHGTTLDTSGIPSGVRRLFLVSGQMVAGNVVYGLIRADALERAQVFRDVMYPDRLLVSELALHGAHRHVTELLWSRRFEWRDDRPARQRAGLWPAGAPWHAHLPAWISHVAVLGRAYGPRAAAAYGAGIAVRIGALWRKRGRKRLIRRKRHLRATAGRAARALGLRGRRTT